MRKFPYIAVLVSLVGFGFATQARASSLPAVYDGSTEIRGLGGPMGGDLNKPSYCSASAQLALKACGYDVRDNDYEGQAKCLNLSDVEERQACRDELAEETADAQEECEDVYDARLEVCALVGEDRYDPDWSPENFVHPDDIGGAVAPNPYFPLVVDAYWILESEDEVVTDTVLDKIKLVEGVPCRVVLDVVEEDGKVKEITDDWYAQDLEGNVWYCGESARDFETFEGDAPAEPELVEIDGSFKVGRDGAHPGIVMLAHPAIGDAYRQEMALGDAEDAAEVLSLTGDESVPAVDCMNQCAVTRDFSALEPGVNEIKHYAWGVGLILEVDDEGNRTELVEYAIP